MLAREKHSSLQDPFEVIKNESLRKKHPGAIVIKLITAVIYGFRNKLNCLSLNTKLGRKRLPGTSALAHHRNRKLQP
jgi:hypothetical protein